MLGVDGCAYMCKMILFNTAHLQIGDDDPGWLRRTHPLFAASLWHQCVGETVLTANAHHKIIFSRAAGRTGVIQLACDNATHAFAPLTDAFATTPPGAPPLWVNACEICTLLHADMTKVDRPFVLMSFDTLNPGIDRGGTMGAYVIPTSFALGWRRRRKLWCIYYLLWI